MPENYNFNVFLKNPLIYYKLCAFFDNPFNYSLKKTSQKALLIQIYKIFKKMVWIKKNFYLKINTINEQTFKKPH